MPRRTLGTGSVRTYQFCWFHPYQQWWAGSTASALAPVCSPSSGCVPVWAPADAETRSWCSACMASPPSRLAWKLQPGACFSPAVQRRRPRWAGSQTWGWSGRGWRSCRWLRWLKVAVVSLFLLLKCWWWTGLSADCSTLGGEYYSSVFSGCHCYQDFAVKQEKKQ